MLEEESKIERLSEEIKKLFDLAFYGIEKDYKNVVMPNKKPKGKNLTDKQKLRNKQISRIRVRIENAFAGVKRLRITSFTTRAKRNEVIDLRFSLSCGLWNFYLWAK